MAFEWLNIDPKELHYHIDQYDNPKQYTKELLLLFKEWGLGFGMSTKVLDLGCGGGAVTNSFAEMYPEVDFTGIDINKDYVSIANAHESVNSNFEVIDMYSDKEMGTLKNYDGLMSFQTLSWLPNYDRFLKLLSILDVEWSLITSLFYDGPVDAEIKIKDYSRKMGDVNYRESFYNIYSLDILKIKLEQLGYNLIEARPFDLGFDIPKPEDKGMSTYTENTIDNKRIQISGPVLMNWYTLLISKKHE
nr:class I SAM-dependent methyltransferase [uncultured Mucilaginibacter sp.]